MQRTAAFDAIVLRCKEVPSGARVVTLLSAEEGISEAFVFGGGKSKLRSLVAPWHRGRAWLYRDAAKNLVKVSDFDPAAEYSGARASLEAIGVASFASEFMEATSGLGGDWADAYGLMDEALAALDEAAGLGAERLADAAGRILAAFIVNALARMGFLPDADECSSCAGAIPRDAVHSYSRRTGGYLCATCAAVPDDGHAVVPVPAGAFAWLAACRNLSDAGCTGLARESLAALKAAALDMARKAVDAPLRTLGSGLL